MDRESSLLAANSIAFEACQAAEAFKQTAFAMAEPCVLYKPTLSLDGNQWCALYGADLQSGVAGFGDSPALACADFNRAWHTSPHNNHTEDE